MTKYIVKNCPAYLYGGCHSENVNFKIDFECCIKNNNCPIKQVVDLVEAENKLHRKRQRLIPMLNEAILQTLQVEEVEK